MVPRTYAYGKKQTIIFVFSVASVNANSTGASTTLHIAIRELHLQGSCTGGPSGQIASCALSVDELLFDQHQMSNTASFSATSKNTIEPLP